MLAPNWTLLNCAFEGEVNLADWQVLRRMSLAPAGLNAPELVTRAAALAGARIATVRDASGLRLAMPVERRFWPVPVWQSLMSAVNFSGFPHVDAALAAPALEALLDGAGAPILLRSVPLDGAFMTALGSAGARVIVVERWERAALLVSGTFEDWFERSFERKRRKEYRRLRSRLAERGRLELRELCTADDARPWIASLLSLEAAGWKGKRGTALKANAKAAETLCSAVAALHDAGHLRFWSIALDGRTIASLYAIVEGDEAWLGKIAYDENFARFSPGVLLVLHATERLFAEGTVTRADSCAIPDHPMIGHLWRDAIAVGDVLVAPRAMGEAKFRAIAAAERAWRRPRAALRNLFHKLTGRHRS